MNATDLQRAAGKRVGVEFILMGFDQQAEIRRYAFQRIAAEEPMEITVDVDMALLPAYGIRIQELPLLCRELLEQRFEEGHRALTLTEAEMRAHAEKRAAAEREAAERRRRPRKSAQQDAERSRHAAAP